jgi:hypothetical protein
VNPSTLHPTWQLWHNPIFRRYCRSRLRPTGLGVAVLISLLIAGFLFSISRAIGIHRTDLSLADAERGAIIPLLVFQALILFVLGTAQVSGGMTAETDEGVIDYQRLIPMTPLSKVLGYLFGLPVREYVMFLTTLPFTAWALWRGEVPFAAWFPIYGILLTTSITYHLTGLLTGTVIRNRRWAFLVSTGLVFCLYTVIPQLANFGLVFFKYLTITPVVQESLPELLPKTAGAIVAAGQRLAPEAKFFNLSFPEATFTLFCQGGFILTFLVMLCRKWRRAESLLLGKIWATGFFIWGQFLFLGNALPLIEPGNLFPSRQFSRQIRILSDWAPNAGEAVLMSGIYGCVTLLFLHTLTLIITPSTDLQIRGWRRTRKQGGTSLPWLSEGASTFGWVAVMASAGAVGWFLFTRALIESRWFPGHEVPLRVLGVFFLVMLAGGISLQALLEAMGRRRLAMAAILVGFVPLMIGAVAFVTSEQLLPAVAWLVGISPISAPLYASASLLSISELPVDLTRSVPRAFTFWLALSVMGAVFLAVKLRQIRKEIAVSANASGSKPLPIPDESASDAERAE